MLGVITFVLGFIFIWIAWGFWAFSATLLGVILLAVLLRPQYAWGHNWGATIGILIVDILGILAVNSIWHEPAYNAVAVLIVVLSYAIK